MSAAPAPPPLSWRRTWQGVRARFFGPTVWLSGRLNFSRKYMLIGLLVMAALAALSTPLLDQTHRQIRATAVERVGIERLADQTKVLTDLVGWRSALLGDGRGIDERALAAAVSATARTARTDGLKDDAERLERAWRAAGGDLAEPRTRFAAATGVINAVLTLIRDDARVYRLNVDPDLDAALDMLSNRLPLVLDTLGKQRDALSISGADITSYALGAQVVLTESAPALRAGVAQLTVSGTDSADLTLRLNRLLADIVRQQDAADRSLDARGALGALGQIARGNGASAKDLLHRAQTEVDLRLTRRIDQLVRAQWIIVALLIGALGAISYLFAGIYISTLRSLKSLSQGTEAFCSGRLDARIQIDTQDELVLVARNFNSVATEFERLLGVIKRQNESREAELETQVRLRTAELGERNHQLRKAAQRVAEELDLARNMQKAILPQTFPDEAGWAVSAAMHPARELGGDFYDCFALPGGRYGVLVADVSGKGVGAAFFMAVARTVLLDLALSDLPPEEVLAKGNDLICDRNPMELFVTACYAVFDPLSGALAYASAGHHAPLVRRTDGRAERLPCANDVALGVMPGLSYCLASATLHPREALLLYTDGVTEAFNGASEAYGDDRLTAWMEAAAPDAAAGDLVTSLVADVAAFVDVEEASDDLTCLVLCRKSGEAMPPHPLDPPIDRPPPTLGEKVEILHHRLASKVEEIAVLAEAVDIALPDRPDLAFTANLCLEELIANIILHGLDGDPGHEIEVFMNRSADWLEIILKDDAPKFDPFAEAPEPDLDLDLDDRPIGGLGVHMVKTMMDAAHAYYDGKGNLIVLLKTLQSSKSPQQ
jgi:serine phosphatase RsbU (regulator of sigma subunit)/anti-sigma regulatory factor (Ser/Thr protein kinase)